MASYLTLLVSNNLKVHALDYSPFECSGAKPEDDGSISPGQTQAFTGNDVGFTLKSSYQFSDVSTTYNIGVQFHQTKSDNNWISNPYGSLNFGTTNGKYQLDGGFVTFIVTRNSDGLTVEINDNA